MSVYYNNFNKRWIHCWVCFLAGRCIHGDHNSKITMYMQQQVALGAPGFASELVGKEQQTRLQYIVLLLVSKCVHLSEKNCIIG